MAETAFTELRTRRLILRPLRPSDALAICRYRSLPEVARFQSWEAFGHTDAERLVAGQQGLAPDKPGTWFQLAIVATEGGEVFGDCGLHFRADDPRQVEVGITLDPACQGQGYAAETLTAVLDYLFHDLGKHRVTATTDAENRPAAALLERLGFRREGHFRQNVWFKGRWGDEFLFALLGAEWRSAGGCARPPDSGYEPGTNEDRGLAPA
jgi:RimJ/RimL family protein N-acetyltransferase